MAGANLSDIILPSFEDEATWFSDADPMSTLARYQNVGAETVVVKNAGDPVSFWSQHGTGTYLVESVEKIIDSTAAGDSFNAEILVGLLREIPLADAINNAAVYSYAMPRIGCLKIRVYLSYGRFYLNS